MGWGEGEGEGCEGVAGGNWHYKKVGLKGLGTQIIRIIMNLFVKRLEGSG